MAGFLTKFIRGAAGAGAELYADRISAEMKADLQTKRDAVLEANRATAAEKTRTFKMEESEKTRAGQMDLMETRQELITKRKGIKSGGKSTKRDQIRLENIIKAETERNEENYGTEEYLTKKQVIIQSQQIYDFTYEGIELLSVPKPKVSKVDDILVQYKDKESIENILDAIINDPNLSEITREDAQKRLKLLPKKTFNPMDAASRISR